VLNRAAGARAIPRATQERIVAAARRFHYRPDNLARSLRQKRSFTVGVMVPEISEGYASLVMSGIEDCLLQEGYLYFITSHRHRDDLIDEYPKLMLGRSEDGSRSTLPAGDRSVCRLCRSLDTRRPQTSRTLHSITIAPRRSRFNTSRSSAIARLRSSRGSGSARTCRFGGTRSGSTGLETSLGGWLPEYARRLSAGGPSIQWILSGIAFWGG